jgi:hypothetical protein
METGELDQNIKFEEIDVMVFFLGLTTMARPVVGSDFRPSQI